MTFQHYKNQFIRELSAHYDKDEAASFFYMALEEWFGLRRIDIALQPSLELTAERLQQFENLKQSLLSYEPIQYLLGRAWFCGMPFRVNPAVLIPRPETEELVLWIASDFKERTPCRITDIGTGSGCIAVSLARMLSQATVTAIDVSESALNTARQNALDNEVQVAFRLWDILSGTSLEPCDVIVSNPPYVRELEKAEIRPNVLAHEPHLALFVQDEDPLLFYRKIAALAFEALTENGVLYFEINQYLGTQTLELVKNTGFKNAELRKDMYGNDRMLRAQK